MAPACRALDVVAYIGEFPARMTSIVWSVPMVSHEPFPAEGMTPETLAVSIIICRLSDTQCRWLVVAAAISWSGAPGGGGGWSWGSCRRLCWLGADSWPALVCVAVAPCQLAHLVAVAACHRTRRVAAACFRRHRAWASCGGGARTGCCGVARPRGSDAPTSGSRLHMESWLAIRRPGRCSLGWGFCLDFFMVSSSFLARSASAF